MATKKKEEKYPFGANDLRRTLIRLAYLSLGYERDMGTIKDFPPEPAWEGRQRKKFKNVELADLKSIIDRVDQLYALQERTILDNVFAQMPPWLRQKIDGFKKSKVFKRTDLKRVGEELSEKLMNEYFLELSVSKFMKIIDQCSRRKKLMVGSRKDVGKPEDFAGGFLRFVRGMGGPKQAALEILGICRENITYRTMYKRVGDLIGMSIDDLFDYEAKYNETVPNPEDLLRRYFQKILDEPIPPHT